MPKNHKGPKTAEELIAEIEAQQGKPAAPGNEHTAEGMETRTPSRREVFSNLQKLAGRVSRHGD